MEILFEDNDMIVVIKPIGIDSQSSKGISADMVSEIKNHIATGNKEPYVGVVHRLDKPVSGIMVFAKNKETAAALSKQLTNGTINKKYYAIVCGKATQDSGKFEDYLIKDAKINISKICDKKTPGAKLAELNYRILKKKYIDGVQLAKVEIELITGRHHQIRVQLAAHNLALLGDRKYNQSYLNKDDKGNYKKSEGLLESEYAKNIALASTELKFTHPKTRKIMKYTYEPDGNVWKLFK